MKEDDRLVCFLIVNFNGSEVLDQCLQSVLNQDYRQMAMVVVDNGSTDRSCHIIRQYTPKVTLLGLDKNYGYAKANNLGLRHILKMDAEYIAFINTDVVLSPDWTHEMIQLMSHHGSDLVQSIITGYPNDQVVDSLGIGISRHFHVYDRGRGTLLPNVQQSSDVIFGPCFAAALVRRDVVERLRVGDEFFDETFTSSLEDVDFCFRANAYGFRGDLLLKPLCHHRRSFTADRLPSKKYFLVGRNYWLLIRKHIPMKWIIKKSPYILFRQFSLLLRSGRSVTQLVSFMTGFGLGIMKLLQSMFSLSPVIQKGYPHQEEVILRILEGNYE